MPTLPLYQVFYRPHANGGHEVDHVRADSRGAAIKVAAALFNVPQSQVDGCIRIGARGFGPR
jgi:hypothetical protein